MARRPAHQQGDTLQRIRQVAFRLFGRYGHDGVSMLQLAQAAGVTKAALYWHFDSKEALYLDCQQQLFALFEAHIFERMNRQQEPAQQLLTMFEGVLSLVLDRRIRDGVAGYWLHPSTLKSSAAARARQRFEAGYVDFLSRVMAGAVAAGSLRDDLDIADLARAVMVVQEGIVLPLRDEPEARTRRLINVMAQLFLRAQGRGPLAGGDIAGD